MMDSKKTEKFDGQKLGLFIFECVMAIVYVALSIVLLFTSFFNRSVPEGLRIGVGIVIGLYGLFRVYRAYVKITQRYE
ncbi:MAG: hypothetical protein FWD60_10520 [Candidatus Azobacteroides sp.]|nr:hypothetical protein [Candidatus Azobacteroides sp.]